MTRKETGIIMDILHAAYPRFYAGNVDMRNAINLWAECSPMTTWLWWPPP